MPFLTNVHSCRLIAITGGRSSDKAELLFMLRQQAPNDIAVLPDSGAALAAGSARRQALPAVWRQLFRHEMSLEGAALDDGRYSIVLCPHSAPECLLTWPGDEAAFWREMGTTREQQYRRYEAVIHLRPPPLREGGTQEEILAHQALERAWSGHQRQYVVDWASDIRRRLSLVAAYLGTRMTEERRAG
jgi:hypothetical protein